MRGFTLLDVMMAILVMTIGVTGLLLMQLTSLAANASTRQISEATQLCQNKAEELRAGNLPLPASPGGEVRDARNCLTAGGEQVDGRGCLIGTDTRAFCATPVPGNRYRRTWVADTDPNHPGRFEVDTAWTSADGNCHMVTVSDER